MARQVLPIVGAVVGAFFGSPQIGYAIGTIVGNIVDPEIIKGPKIGDAGTQTSAEGVPRPVIFGTAPVVGNVIMRGNRQIKKKREGGKGGPVTETERVYWTFAIRIGEPIQNVLRIWEDEKLVYDIRPESEIVDESADYAKKFRLYYGSEDQLPDPDLEVIKGVGNVCAHHGTAYIVFPNYDLTDRRESIPTYRFEVAGTATDVGQPVDSIVVTSSGVLSSPEGVTWGNAPVEPTSTGYAMAGPDRFVMWTPTTAFYLVRGGTSWVTSTGDLGGVGGTRSGVYFKGLYIIGGGINGLYISGDSAASFTAYSYPTYPRSNYIEASPDLVLTFSLYSDYIYTSTTGDGTWTERAAHGLSVSAGAVAYGDQMFKLGAASSGGSIKIVTTANGSTVIEDTLPSVSSTVITALAYGEIGGNRIWMAGTDDGTLLFKHNDDAWAVSTGSTTGPVVDIFFNGAVFVIVSTLDPTDGYIYTSADGDTITVRRHDTSVTYRAGASLNPVSSAQGEPVALSTIVGALHGRVKQASSKYDVTELTDLVDGVAFAGDYTVADGIRSVLTPYFSDASEYDDATGWKLHYIKRGKAVVKTLTEADLVDEPEESTRESAIEFPAKLHMFFQNPQIGYAPAKATSTRSSPDIRVVGEASVQVPVVIDDVDEAAKIANKLHKVSWAEAGGDVKFTVTDEHLDLVASDNIGLSLRGTVRRLRITKIEDDPGTRTLTCRIDRQSAYTSNLTGVPLPPPTPPPPSLVGPSLFVNGDWPALRDTDDVLGYYVGAGGTTPAWYGAVVQRQDSIGDFADIASFSSGAVIGTLQSAVGAASEYYTDTTNALVVHFDIDPELESLTNAQFLSEAGGLAVENADGTWELMQYRDAAQDSEGLYTLTTLHRGLLNSGASAHASGGRVVVLSTVKFVAASAAMIDAALTHRAVSYGLSPETATEYTQTYTAVSQTEFPCASLTIAHNLDSVDCSTVPRHRFGTDDNPIRSINWTGYYWTATDGVNSATVEGAPAAASFNVTGWSSPITVTVAQVNRYTGVGPAITEVIA